MACCLERFVADLQAVVLFVQRTNTGQNLDRLFDGRFFDLHRLEAALEGGIPFDVLAIFVEGGGANRLQFATGEGRLQDIGRVDRAFRRACSNEGVQFIDEEDRCRSP